MRNLYTVFVLLAVAHHAGAYQRYDNFKLLQIVPKNLEQLEAIRVLTQQDKFSTIDFWLEPSAVNRSIDVMISSEELTAFGRYLSQSNIQSKIVIDNVQNLIDDQKSHVDRASLNLFKPGDKADSFAIDQYHSIKEIYDWVDSLVAKYPNLVSTLSIGSSFEKRDMRLVKIGTQGTNKPGYFIDAGIHAREWISVSTAVYIINELVTKYDSNPSYKELVDKIDFFILPSVNPDGYEYTRSNARMWRKTRSGPYGPTGCRGVDPNRNFDFHWMESGSSQSPCQDIYAGPKAFSEIECTNLANYLKSHKELKAYMTLHSYSELFMYGYGYKAHTYPPDVAELKALAIEAVAAIKAVHGREFEVGSPTDTLYAASGASDDWAKGVANIKYVYTLELRPGDSDPVPEQGFGFALPPRFIIPVGEETWAGLQVVARKIING